MRKRNSNKSLGYLVKPKKENDRIYGQVKIIPKK